MIKKLKTKFIFLSMTTLFILLSVIIIGMNIINYNSIILEADDILLILSQNHNSFPEFGDINNEKLPPHKFHEPPRESRYFYVLIPDNIDEFNMIFTDTSKITSVDHAQAIEYSELVLKENKEKGFVDGYRYLIKYEYDGTQVTFLDMNSKLNSFYTFLYTSILMAVVGLIIAFIVIFILSGKIIKPIAESYEKQKRFITDAGHEIKTPLTIINANTDILELEFSSENECINDIKQQTKRLRSLTDELVLLARMEEAENNLQKIEFPISEVVSETANSFRAIAIQEEKDFICNIQPLLSLNGNSNSIKQLVSIFIDNSLKYSPYNGKIEITLKKQNKTICLSVFNTTESEVDSEQLKYIFDRFYRLDSSRNSETGGHGIGLSIAKAIVTAHGGKISVSTKDRFSFTISAVFPT